MQRDHARDAQRDHSRDARHSERLRAQWRCAQRLLKLYSSYSSCGGAAVVRLWRGRLQQLLALYECAARAGPQLHGDAEDAEAHKRGEASGEGGEEREQAEGACDAEVRLQLDCTQLTSTQVSRYV